MRFLRARPRVLLRLAGWSVLEAGQTFLLGYALARALDEGFLAGRADVGLGWLAVAGAGTLVGAYGTGRVYRAVAALVEPLRDRLVTRVVERGVRDGDGGALSGLTQQVEIARDTFAGLVMVSRSFLFTSAGALVGLLSLAPPLLLVVLPPLAAGVGLFVATLRPLARRQEEFLAADEALAGGLGVVCPGLRDVTAAGAEERIAGDLGALVDAESRAARSLARWGVARVACLAIGGHLPVVLLLAGAPWLLAHGTTPGALMGALAYVTQSLLPALGNLIHGLGTSGSRLTVVLRRLAPAGEPTGPAPSPGGGATAVAGAAGGRAAGAAGVPSPERSQEGSRAGDGTSPALAKPGAGQARRSAGPARPAVTPASAGDRGPRPPHPPGTRPPGEAGGAARPMTDAPPPRPSPPAFSLASVTFAYGPASAPVVDDLSLDLPAGGHLAVVGPSGSGKSTLAALLAGLLEPGRGTVRVHGRPVAEATAWRVLVPQEAYVFGGTLAENLAYLRADGVPEADMLAAAEAVGLTPLLDRLGGPEAVVEPAALSAGERQLIALTRAHLAHAPLALLDEATCHLDPEAEERAERAFTERPGGTLLVVAHRISSARRAERVLVMDGPRTAYGTHAEVLRRSALYRALVGRWEPPSQPALPLRDADGVDAVAGAGLAGDGRHVVAHGPVGQVQAPGDLRDGGALGREG
ncbi:ATP-binding cassette domain-containing protein [Streptomyces sp. NPDC006527]|uniref:ATP-binding cassette domain-containing protein n=1 Tax=Streptomyces sp. NPDC006527 TaxID=3364749 RepID=UPI00367FE24D